MINRATKQTKSLKKVKKNLKSIRYITIWYLKRTVGSKLTDENYKSTNRTDKIDRKITKKKNRKTQDITLYLMTRYRKFHCLGVLVILIFNFQKNNAQIFYFDLVVPNEI